MLNIEGINFNDLYTWSDLKEYALVANPERFEFVEKVEKPKDWNYHGDPYRKDVPFHAEELQIIMDLERYSLVVTRGFEVNNKLRRLMYHLQDLNPNSEIIDLHLYASKGNTPFLFDIHHDRPHNLIIQVEGVTKWTVYNECGTLDNIHASKDNEFTVKEQKTLNPGEYIWIPSRNFHKPEADESRLSVSVLYW